DGVVQDGLVQSDLDVVRLRQRPEQRERVADLGGHGLADSLLFPALDHVAAIWIPKGDSHPDALAALGGQDSLDPLVFGEEQSTVGKDADLVLGGAEEPGPNLPRDGPSMRIDHAHFLWPRPP